MNEEVEFSLLKPADKLVICANINADLCGELVKIEDNVAEVLFAPTNAMHSDNESAIHAGFVYSSASYAALCAINKKNSIIIASETKFFAPIELGHEILFKAVALQNSMKKCEVKVEGFLLDIKVFEAIFYIAIFDKKLFQLKDAEI